jgi:hypothetical protein
MTQEESYYHTVPSRSMTPSRGSNDSSEALSGATDRVFATVREHPLASFGAAVAAGVVVGRMTSGRTGLVAAMVAFLGRSALRVAVASALTSIVSERDEL